MTDDIDRMIAGMAEAQKRAMSRHAWPIRLQIDVPTASGDAIEHGDALCQLGLVSTGLYLRDYTPRGLAVRAKQEPNNDPR